MEASAKRAKRDSPSSATAQLTLRQLPHSVLVGVVAALSCGQQMAKISSSCRAIAATVKEAVKVAAQKEGRAIPDVIPGKRVFDYGTLCYKTRKSSWTEWLDSFDDLWAEDASWCPDPDSAEFDALRGTVHETILLENPHASGSIPGHGSKCRDYNWNSNDEEAFGISLVLDDSRRGRLKVRGVDHHGLFTRSVTAVFVEHSVTPTGRKQVLVKEDTKASRVRGEDSFGHEDGDLLETLNLKRPIQLELRMCKRGVKFRFDCWGDTRPQYTETGDILIVSPQFIWLGPFLLRATYKGPEHLEDLLPKVLP